MSLTRKASYWECRHSRYFARKKNWEWKNLNLSLNSIVHLLRIQCIVSVKVGETWKKMQKSNFNVCGPEWGFNLPHINIRSSSTLNCLDCSYLTEHFRNMSRVDTIPWSSGCTFIFNFRRKQIAFSPDTLSAQFKHEIFLFRWKTNISELGTLPRREFLVPNGCGSSEITS